MTEKDRIIAWGLISLVCVLTIGLLLYNSDTKKVEINNNIKEKLYDEGFRTQEELGFCNNITNVKIRMKCLGFVEVR